MATPKKAGEKIKEKKSEAIEIGAFTDVSKKNVAEQKSQVEPQSFAVGESNAQLSRNIRKDIYDWRG